MCSTNTKKRPGWESQLLETGFLAMFLVPWLSLSRFPAGSPAPLVCVWGYRWLLFRVMVRWGRTEMGLYRPLPVRRLVLSNCGGPKVVFVLSLV